MLKKLTAILISSSIIAAPTTMEKMQMQINKLEQRVESMPSSHRNFKQSLNSYHAIPVMTSAIWGIISEYDGSDLIVSYSSMNQDLSLLKHRFKGAWSKNYSTKNRPIIQLSGGIEGQIIQNSKATDLDLSRFELDVLADINPYMSAMSSLSYNPSSSDNLDRTESSNIYLKRAFITLGQLKSSPWYATIGQMYMPFGRYSSLMLSSGSTSKLGKTTGRGLVVGYYGLNKKSNGLISSAYIMQGKTKATNTKSRLNQWGINMIFNHNDFQVGSGLIRNLADSNTISQKLIDDSVKDQITQKAYGFDFYSIINIGQWRISGEYVTALQNIKANVTDYAKPAALHFEVDKAFGNHNIPSNIFVGFDRTYNADSFAIAKTSLSVGAYAHFWKNTLEAIEYKHNNTSNSQIDKNTLTLQIGVYF